MFSQQHSIRRQELVSTLIVCALVFAVSATYDLLETFARFAEAHESWQLDELVITSVALCVALAIIAVRRGREARQEARLRGESEARVRASERRFATAFEATPQPTIVSDLANGVVIDANEAFVQLVGHSRGTLVGRSTSELPVWGHAGAHEMVRDRLATHGRVSSLALDMTHADATVRHTLYSGVVVELEGRDVVLSSVTDVTDQRRLESELEHQAFHDTLTGLANRALFRDRVERAIARAPRGGTVAAMYLDLDDFKRVNDALGHAAGDALLRGVAKRLLHATRRSDTVARLGGDEFAILIESHHASEAADIADRVMAALRQSMTIEGRDLAVAGSLGYAIATPDDTPETLLRNADVAMYAAKGRGKGGIVAFEEAMHAEALGRMELEIALQKALDHGEFRLEYQPIVDLPSGNIRGLEALVRWDHPRRGTVPPMQFIPIAEETGLILPLGRWVLDEACRQGADWRARGEREFELSVNVSGRQLASDAIVDDVARALAKSGFPASALTLEITESVIVERSTSVLARLHRLKALGVRLAVDDFGTGHASITYLREFPLDMLKIDRAFVAGVNADSREAVLTRIMLALGDSLQLTTVAEGVEDDAQRAALESLGCDQAQGYLFARPLRPADAEALLGVAQLAEAYAA